MSPIPQIETLTQLNIDDFLRAFGLEHLRYGRGILEALCRWLAQRFAYQIIVYDQITGTQGLQAGGQWFVKQFTRSLNATGQEYIPLSGLLLIVSNHPGLADTLALFATIPRPDLRVVARDRPFLRALPHTAERLIYVPETASGRIAAIRRVTEHLRGGGAILTFPAGEIEPDPAVLPGASESLQRWSESILLFTRLVPETQIVPAIVSGVLYAQALRHPLTRIRRQQKDREWLGATLQMLVQLLSRSHWRTDLCVAYGHPLIASGSETMPAIRSEAADLIAQSINTLPPK